MIWRGAVVALVLLCVAPSTAVAQSYWDPGGAVAAYLAALNAHEVAPALALFDETGSATDMSGRHYAGRSELTEFLLSSGFGDPAAHITTSSLLVVANRALWTYTCSCAAASTDVRMVMTGNKISVFAIMAPPGPPPRRAQPVMLPWQIGIVLVAAAGALAGGLGLSRGRASPPVTRASQGRLLSALALARTARPYTLGGADSDRVELPAAAMTSFNNSDDSAGPWSRYRKHDAARPGSR